MESLIENFKGDQIIKTRKIFLTIRGEDVLIEDDEVLDEFID